MKVIERSGPAPVLGPAFEAWLADFYRCQDPRDEGSPHSLTLARWFAAGVPALEAYVRLCLRPTFHGYEPPRPPSNEAPLLAVPAPWTR